MTAERCRFFSPKGFEYGKSFEFSTLGWFCEIVPRNGSVSTQNIQHIQHTQHDSWKKLFFAMPFNMIHHASTYSTWQLKDATLWALYPKTEESVPPLLFWNGSLFEIAWALLKAGPRAQIRGAGKMTPKPFPPCVLQKKCYLGAQNSGALP